MKASQQDQQDPDELLQCQVCQCIDTIDGYDVIGACPGNVFCNSCGTEIDASTGEKKKLCGRCSGCRSLKESRMFAEAKRTRGEA